MADKKPNGRPKKEFSREQFERLCEIQCTKEEIAYIFNMSDSTLTRRVKEEYGESFEEVFEKKSARGRESIRRKQFELAVEKGDRAMLIFLGKQYLGQTDDPESLKLRRETAENSW